MVAARSVLIKPYIRQAYQLEELKALWHFLSERGTLTFTPLDNGLFSAAAVNNDTAYTGYEAVWVRDNIYVAYAHYLDGTAVEIERAISTVRSLARFFWKARSAFERIIDANQAPANQMARPHIRFKGQSLEKIDQPWNHAQNDALGYFLWFFCQLVLDKTLAPTAEDYRLLALFPLYFEAVQYWQDEDSGHWEESPKVEVSSIGAVVSGLRAMQAVLAQNSLVDLRDFQGRTVSSTLLSDLIDRGEQALARILPSESIQLGKERRYDAALTFLAYPLRAVSIDRAQQIIFDVVENLMGDRGISRYKGDSFWCRDYKDIPESIRTDIAEKREAWLEANNRELSANEEAQWCIFDPIISAFYAQQYQQVGERKFLERQTVHFNRAIAQLTSTSCPHGELKCPELYYLQSGKWIANDATPLLWTQANLLIALKWMKRSLAKR